MTPSKNMRSLIGSSLAILALSLTLSACEEEQQSPPVILAPAFSGLSANDPPPAPVELPPVIGDPAHQTWRSGYWSYENNQFTWVAGKIIDKPTFTAVWASDHWEKRKYGWAFVPGYWQ